MNLSVRALPRDLRPHARPLPRPSSPAARVADPVREAASRVMEQLEGRRLLAAAGLDVSLHDDHHDDHDDHEGEHVAPDHTHHAVDQGSLHSHRHGELPLLEKLPESVARVTRATAQEGILLDKAGNQFFYDAAPAIYANLGDPTPAEGGLGAEAVEGGGGADGDLQRALAVPVLHSNPSATQKIFLDFDGHIVRGTSWNNELNGGKAIHAQPYSRDDDVFNFSDAELTSIREIWRRVAEDFAPFNVDVTTEDPGASAFTAGATALRVLITTDVDSAAMGGTGARWFEGAGGVAYLGSWRWTSDTPVWVFENNLGNGFAKYVAEAASHEAGHAFDLRHDGNSSTGYYSGHGSGATGWAPIMGLGYYKPLSQWSRGEYSNANNTEDDLALLTQSSNKLTVRTDDHGNAISSATTLQLKAEDLGGGKKSYIIDRSGLITTRGDVDVFKLDFTAGAGKLSLEVSPRFAISGYANLDLKADLLDANGQTLLSVNPADALDAYIERDLAAGVYYLRVDGVGKGNPDGDGYSDYGSLGEYDLFGDYTFTTSGTSDSSVKLDAGVLRITGQSATSNHGVVHLIDSGATIRVTLNGKQTSFTAGSVQRIEFRGGAANDEFYVTDMLSLPVVAYGEGGDDYLDGAMGPDTLYGGAGNDTLDGDGGWDTGYDGESLSSIEEVKTSGGNTGDPNVKIDAGVLKITGSSSSRNHGVVHLIDSGATVRVTLNGKQTSFAAALVQRIEFRGGDANDEFYVSDFFNIPVIAHGFGGDDYLDAAMGPDTLYGGAGNDTLDGDGGWDTGYDGETLSSIEDPRTSGGNDGDDDGTTGGKIDFENLSVGRIAGGVYKDPLGFTFANLHGGGGSSTEDLLVHADEKGYSSKVILPVNWGRKIAVFRTDSASFDLASFDYATSIYGGQGDAVVTGFFADGSTQAKNISFSSKQMTTLELGWSALKRVEVNYAGGINAAHGALDNFVLGTGNDGGDDEGNDTDAPAGRVEFESLALGQQASGVYNASLGYTFTNADGAGGSSSEPWMVYGGDRGYASKVLHPRNWGRKVVVTRTAGGAFDLRSFDYATSVHGGLTDAVVTGFFANGSQQQTTWSTSSKGLQTLNLNWKNLTRLEINFVGGSNSAYGAVDNFVFGAPTAAPVASAVPSLFAQADEGTDDLGLFSEQPVVL